MLFSLLTNKEQKQSRRITGKKSTLLTLLLLIVSSPLLIAQAPEAFKYHSVVRDSTGAALVNQVIKLRISITTDTLGSTPVYQEVHDDATNAFGLLDVYIGRGTPTIGTFAAIDWSTGVYYIEVEVDVDGNGNYHSLGQSEMLSVPYALYAENATNVDDADADPTNEIQDISIAGNDLSISSGSTITLPAGADNLGNHTANQNLQLSGYWLSNDGNDEGVFVNTNGNVGVGDSLPASKLTVHSLSLIHI